MIDQTTTDLSLTVRRVIKATPEAIYQAWLDPMKMKRFMTPGPGMRVGETACDPRVGGRFLVVMVGERELPHEGSFQVLDPFKRLVFTWESPFSAPDTTVEIVLTPVAEGTEVALTQVKFVSEESRDNHKAGWGMILAALEQAV
jgi:uncharacterized protein YndB with AHSA1/START domain